MKKIKIFLIVALLFIFVKFFLSTNGIVNTSWCEYDGPGNSGHCYTGLRFGCNTLFSSPSNEKPSPYMPGSVPDIRCNGVLQYFHQTFLY